MTRGEFIPSDLDSVLNVIGLSPPDPLDTFGGDYECCIYLLFTLLLSLLLLRYIIIHIIIIGYSFSLLLTKKYFF